jgi:hypothetical protein
MTPSRAGRQVLTAVLLLLGAAACAGGGGGTGAGAPAPAQRDVLMSEEIQRTSAVTAYDAVRQLRPQWLRRRGRSSIQNATAEVLVVYLDGARFGGPDMLRSIAVGSVLEIRHLAASDATTRFGTGHAGGALLVRTR